MKIYQATIARKQIRWSNSEKLDFEISATEFGISEANSVRKDERKQPPEELVLPIINHTESLMTCSTTTHLSGMQSKCINTSNWSTIQTTLVGMNRATSKEAK